MVNKHLSTIQDIIFENKEKLSDEEYNKCMNALSKVEKGSKTILLAVPVKRGVHQCPVHGNFDLVTECLYLTLTPDEYKYYDDIEIGASFFCLLYQPLSLLYSSGTFMFDHELGGSKLTCRNIIGKVLFVKEN